MLTQANVNCHQTRRAVYYLGNNQRDKNIRQKLDSKLTQFTDVSDWEKDATTLKYEIIYTLTVKLSNMLSGPGQ